jgi:hypothetical protein
MPVYTFRIHSNGGPTAVEETHTFADADAAREHAKAIGEKITAAAAGPIAWSIVVTDERSRVVFQKLRALKK